MAVQVGIIGWGTRLDCLDVQNWVYREMLWLVPNVLVLKWQVWVTLSDGLVNCRRCCKFEYPNIQSGKLICLSWTRSTNQDMDEEGKNGDFLFSFWKQRKLKLCLHTFLDALFRIGLKCKALIYIFKIFSHFFLFSNFLSLSQIFQNNTFFQTPYIIIALLFSYKLFQ